VDGDCAPVGIGDQRTAESESRLAAAWLRWLCVTVSAPSPTRAAFSALAGTGSNAYCWRSVSADPKKLTLLLARMLNGVFCDPSDGCRRTSFGTFLSSTAVATVVRLCLEFYVTPIPTSCGTSRSCGIVLACSRAVVRGQGSARSAWPKLRRKARWQDLGAPVRRHPLRPGRRVSDVPPLAAVAVRKSD